VGHTVVFDGGGVNEGGEGEEEEDGFGKHYERDRLGWDDKDDWS